MPSPAWRASVVLAAVICLVPPADADPIAVRFAEGVVHGFLTLRSPEGALLASGDLLQTASGGRVKSRLVFRFADGSLSDETAVFTQRGHFRLVSDHSIQRGPAFEHSLEMAIDAGTGVVTVRYRKEGDEEKIEREHLTLPPDVANGMVPMLLKNARPGAAPQTLSLVAATPKPRLVKLAVSVAGKDSLSIAGTRHTATHYVLKVDIGGLTGLIAPLVGKQPPDSHVWILDGDVPAFLRSQSPMFAGGPLWQTDLVSPEWPSH
jgi:hypothetical protein